jgi:hypothetical protein
MTTLRRLFAIVTLTLLAFLTTDAAVADATAASSEPMRAWAVNTHSCSAPSTDANTERGSLACGQSSTPYDVAGHQSDGALSRPATAVVYNCDRVQQLTQFDTAGATLPEPVQGAEEALSSSLARSRVAANSAADLVAAARAGGGIGAGRNVAGMTLEAGGVRLSETAVSGVAARAGMVPTSESLATFSGSFLPLRGSIVDSSIPSSSCSIALPIVWGPRLMFRVSFACTASCRCALHVDPLSINSRVHTRTSE